MDPDTPVTIGTVLDVLKSAGLLASCTFAAGQDESVPLTGCSFDSRQTRPGDLFYAKGAHFSPRYLTSALKAGAPCYMADVKLEPEIAGLAGTDAATGILVTDIRRAMAVVSPVIYHEPGRDLRIVGITGTKGKSSTAFMLKKILDAAGDPSGLMGSILNDDGIERFEAFNTTPEAPELWRHLANCRDDGWKNMVIEVSSQALKYERVYGVPFTISCFTNISRDHISPVEHKDFEDYFTSKLRIFEGCRTAVVNLGTAHLDRVLDAARKSGGTIVTTGVGHAEADACATNVRPEGAGVAFTLKLSAALAEPGHEGEKYDVVLGVPGTFNVENALEAITCARLMGVPMDCIISTLRTVAIPGRMEMVRSDDDQILGIVDFAHNKISYEAVFGYVEKHYADRTIVSVFGARGDKAQERRRDCPQVAGKYSDFMVLTEVDSAHEDTRALCEEVASHLPEGANYEIEVDRDKAVERAFEYARAHKPAVVLLLEKGAETHQQRGDNFVTVRGDIELAREFING